MKKLFLLITIVVNILAVGCTAWSTPVVDPTATAEPSSPDVIEAIHGLSIGGFSNAPSIELQIIEADIIVVATLVSATVAVQQDGNLFRPGQALRFRSSEYLKGSGPAEFVVEVPIYEYPLSNRADAMTAAQKYLEARDTTYDSRAGVLFLHGPLTAATLTTGQTGSGAGRSDTSSSTTTTAFNFLEGEIVGTGSWEYSVNTKERVWLPAVGSSSTDSRRSSSSNTNSEFITDGQTVPPAAITLSDLRSKINAIETRLASGAHIEGFRECVRSEIRRERVYRGQEVVVIPYAISSGAAPRTQSIIDESVGTLGGYWRFHNTGRDADLFESTVIDEDDDPGRYRMWSGPSRPLPSGEYEYDPIPYPPRFVPCGFIPEPISTYEVTVVAPAGTLHEAFFDPVTVGTAVKADGSNGVLKPTSFTVGNTSTEIDEPGVEPATRWSSPWAPTYP